MPSIYEINISPKIDVSRAILPFSDHVEPWQVMRT